MRDEFGVFCKGIFYIYAVWGYRGEGEVNSNLEYKNINGNIAYSETPGVKVFPCTGIAIKDKNKKKVDLHFDFIIEVNNCTDEKDFTAIHMERLRSSISVNTLTWTAIYNSRVTVEEATYTSSIRGRAGLRLRPDGQIARSYTSDLNTIGSWQLTKKELFAVGSCFHVDIWGADYT